MCPREVSCAISAIAERQGALAGAGTSAPPLPAAPCHRSLVAARRHYSSFAFGECKLRLRRPLAWFTFREELLRDLYPCLALAVGLVMQQRTADVDVVVREFHEALARSSDMAVAVAAIQVGCAGAAESARLERGCQGRVREFHEALARSTAPCPS